MKALLTQFVHRSSRIPHGNWLFIFNLSRSLSRDFRGDFSAGNQEPPTSRITRQAEVLVANSLCRFLLPPGTATHDARGRGLKLRRNDAVTPPARLSDRGRVTQLHLLLVITPRQALVAVSSLGDTRSQFLTFRVGGVRSGFVDEGGG